MYRSQEFAFVDYLWKINQSTYLSCRMSRHIHWFSLRTLQWRHNKRDGVSNHRRLDCLLNRLSMRRSRKTSMLRVTGLCEGNSRVTVNSPHKWPVTRKNPLFHHAVRLHLQSLYLMTYALIAHDLPLYILAWHQPWSMGSGNSPCSSLVGDYLLSVLVKLQAKLAIP